MWTESDPGSFALVGRLAAGAAHDINNYLTAAQASLTLAERDPDRRDLRQVRVSFDAIARIARSLTIYARGGQPVAEPVELEPLVRRTLDAFGRSIPEGVRVIVAVAGGVAPVRGVASELEQVILNLVINACDAMVQGGTLWLILERGSAGYVRLEVSDSGGGLPPDVVASTSAISPSSKRGAGRGLGLGIVRLIIERHGGSLELGRRVGGGTTIEVSLPV